MWGPWLPGNGRDRGSVPIPGLLGYPARVNNASRSLSRPAVVKAAIAVVAVAGLLALALALLGSTSARVGAALAVVGGAAGVWLMLRALKTQSEAHTAELREQARRATEALKAQHERERTALAAIEVRTQRLHGTIGELRTSLADEGQVHDATRAELSASTKKIIALDARVAELDADLARTGAELERREADLAARTAELAQAQKRIEELEAMVTLYETELTAQGGAEVVGLPRRVEAKTA